MGKGTGACGAGRYHEGMRFRVPLALSVVALVFIVPSVAHATTIPFWGPLVPSIVAKCAAGWGGIIQLVNNVIALLVTFVIFIVAPFFIAWGGFLFVASAANPANRARARGILIHTAVGILIALWSFFCYRILFRESVS